MLGNHNHCRKCDFKSNQNHEKINDLKSNQIKNQIILEKLKKTICNNVKFQKSSKTGTLTKKLDFGVKVQVEHKNLRKFSEKLTFLWKFC